MSNYVEVIYREGFTMERHVLTRVLIQTAAKTHIDEDELVKT